MWSYILFLIKVEHHKAKNILGLKTFKFYLYYKALCLKIEWEGHLFLYQDTIHHSL